MLELSHVSRSFVTSDGSPLEVIRDVSLTVREKEFVAIVGPSGCGKTTLLRMIAGLDVSSDARIVLDGKRVTGPSRDRGMVFQSFALFPWLTVTENIASGLRFSGKLAREIRPVVERYLELTGLQDFANAYPATLSGGMKQRVAIARTLAAGPQIILMDEPFGALDSQTRSRMQEFLADLWTQESKTVIFVTHDVEEAIFLADRVFLMTPRPGSIKREFRVPFGLRRPHALKLSEEFFALKREIVRTMEQDDAS